MNRRGFLGLIAALLAGGRLPGCKAPRMPAPPRPDWKFGEVMLRARKMAALVKIPNELVKWQ